MVTGCEAEEVVKDARLLMGFGVELIGILGRSAIEWRKREVKHDCKDSDSKYLLLIANNVD